MVSADEHEKGNEVKFAFKKMTSVNYGLLAPLYNQKS